MADQKYAQVLLDVANRRLDRLYTYLVPSEMRLAAGMTVLVPLQNRQVQGLVARLSEDPDEAEGRELRPVLKILEEECLLPPNLLELAHWMAETTICPMAQSLHTVWPFLRGKTDKWVIPQTPLSDPEVMAWRETSPDAFLTLQILWRARRGGIPVKDLSGRMRRQGIGRDPAEVLAELDARQAIRWEVRFSGARRGAETERQGLHSGGPGTPPDVPAQKPEAQIPGAEVRAEALESDALTAAQREAVTAILAGVTEGREQTILLHGVTGSGKTEVYRRVIAEVAARGQTAILLVPEISLTSQVARRFLDDFGAQAAVVHSGLPLSKKQRIWEEILAGQIKVVIGARSAVFAPLPNLGLIILDEEHDGAYQQEENPKYHARDVARRRMQQLGSGAVVLGSATPSLEAYAAAKRGIVRLLELPERFNRRPLPRVDVVDMKNELSGGNKSIFSALLAQKIDARLERDEQVILFLNRRGYATYVFCRECGYVATCPQCDVSLTYHSQRQALRCHYCGYRTEVSHHCPQCGSIYLRFFGQGTQRLEEEVQTRFPEARVLRLDADATEGQRHQKIIGAFRRREADILVGTQMLAKGFDFPEVTLVGVMLADQLLNMPDFRARERAFQLLTQVAGRAGRQQKAGEVILQTYTPQDRALLYAAHHDYRGFFQEELFFRKKLTYPPFAHIIRVTILHEQEERAVRAAGELAAAVRAQPETTPDGGYQVMGPAPALIPKLKKTYRWQLLVKGKQPAVLRRIVHRGVSLFYRQPGGTSAGTRLNIEVNPLN